MQAEKIMLETDPGGRLIGLPKLPGNRRIEAIFLILDGKTDASVKRQPHPDLAGRVKVQGDVLSSAPAADWDLPK